MTRDEILSLTGPALSEAVAEHAMGWRKLCQAEVVDRIGSTWTDEKNNWHLIPRRPLPKRDQGLIAIVAETWEPHRDMRAAWQVFMAAPGDKKTLRSWGSRFFACIDEGDLIEAESPEVTICRAALLSVLATETALLV